MRRWAVALILLFALGSPVPTGASTSGEAGVAAAAQARKAKPRRAARAVRKPAKREPAKQADVGRAILAEINRMRRDPKGYAKMLRREYRPKYDGALLRLPGRDPIRTREGVKALDEAIRVLERAKPVRALTWSPGLAKAAAQHVADIGPRGAVDHQGKDGSWPHQRMGRHGQLLGTGGENIDFGFADARGVVVHLVIDDNVPDRGHRKNMLDATYRHLGAACGRHKVYKVTCVMDLAEAYRDRR
jgi:uncharacterized protein YkwD